MCAAGFSRLARLRDPSSICCLLSTKLGTSFVIVINSMNGWLAVVMCEVHFFFLNRFIRLKFVPSGA